VTAGLVRAYKDEVRRAVRRGDMQRAQELREWAFEQHNFDILDFMVDTDTR
jgi:hypothetical protein